MRVMNDKPLSDKELASEMRKYAGFGDTRYPPLRAEFELRQAKYNTRYMFWATVAAAVAAIGSMVAAIASVIGLHYLH